MSETVEEVTFRTAYEGGLAGRYLMAVNGVPLGYGVAGVLIEHTLSRWSRLIPSQRELIVTCWFGPAMVELVLDEQSQSLTIR